MLRLFKIQGFLSYILIMFLNATTDLGHKIILQNTIFKAYEGSELVILTSIINSLILLPFIFLFLPAGYISDKYEKTKVIKYSALLAIVITSLILLSYYLGMFYMSFILTFILASQSAIYSPAKYGLIKLMVGDDNLTSANAMVQMVTIISILLGAILYSVGFEYLLQNQTIKPNEILTYITPMGFVLVLASIAEYLFAIKLIKEFKIKKQSDTKNEKSKNTLSLKKSLFLLKENNIIWLSIIGLGIFWAISQVVVAVFGDLLKSMFDVKNSVTVQGMISLSGIGIIIGSIFASKASKNYIEIGLIPFAIFGITVSLYLVPNATSLIEMSFILVFFGLFSGLFIVPLNSLIQFYAPINVLGKVLAGNNLIQNIFMFTFLCLTIVCGFFEVSSKYIVYALTFISFLTMCYTLYILPQPFVRYIIKAIMSLKFTLKVDGLHNININRGVLLLGNHISFLDWAILQMAYPKTIRFVIDRYYYNKWYLNKILKFFQVIPISIKGSKTALREVTKALQDGDTIALFPEGYISKNGHLGEFQRGFELACKELNDDIVIVPFFIKGIWETKFSHASNKIKKYNNKNISVTYGKELAINTNSLKLKKEISKLSIVSWDNSINGLKPIQNSWLKTAKKVGNNLSIVDSVNYSLTGHKFIVKTFQIAKQLKNNLKTSQNIGIILPMSIASSSSNMAILTLGKTIVNLNYTSGDENLTKIIKSAKIDNILTSRLFIKQLINKGFDLTNILKDKNIIYMEDIEKKFTKYSFIITNILVRLMPTIILELLYIKSSKLNDTAVIMFSNDNEKNQDGIILSHKNILGNIKQTLTFLNPNDDDIILGAVPKFNPFGFTITTLLPLVEGIALACHSEVEDGFGIGKLAFKYKTTILFSTPQLYKKYLESKRLKPLMFKDIKIAMTSGEVLSQEIKSEFKSKFDIEIFEGYGIKTINQIVSFNTKDELMDDFLKIQKGHKDGTVGLPLPGSSFMIVDPNSFKELDTNEVGRVLIAGIQLMNENLNDTETETFFRCVDGIRWFITDDMGKVDKDGFLTLVE